MFSLVGETGGSAKSTRRTRRRSTQLSAQDWIDFAKSVLAKNGIDAVRIEPIAQKLGVTKGSFYHHFPDRPAYHKAILDDWRKHATAAIINRLEGSHADPRVRLKELLNLPVKSARSREGANLELAIRQWARRDKNAKAVLQEVDEHRLSYISTLYQELGVSKSNARARAFNFYSLMMGEAVLSTPDAQKLVKMLEEQILGAREA